MILFPAEIGHAIMVAFSIEHGSIWHAAIGFWVPILWLMSAVMGAALMAGVCWAVYCVTRGLAAWALEVIAPVAKRVRAAVVNAVSRAFVFVKSIKGLK